MELYDDKSNVDRVLLFCFYEADGILKDSVKYLFSELKTVTSKSVVIINGECVSQSWFRDNADLLIKRENVGFDAGAYKVALLNEQVQNWLSQADELVLCNDTFYGPFKRFTTIFKEMAEKECDYWGLNYADSGVTEFLQSYFLVFRRNIIKSNTLERFFESYVDAFESDIHRILILFERGISRYLEKKGFSRGYYCQQTYHIFNCFLGSVVVDNLPILKKKVFSDKYYNSRSMKVVLSWIHKNTDYPIEFILKEGNLGDSFLERDYILDNTMLQAVDKSTRRIEDVFSFIRNSNGVYIWGTGGLSRSILDELYLVYAQIEVDQKILGYISSSAIEGEYFFGKKVMKPESVDLSNSSICLFMNRENTLDIIEKYDFSSAVFSLWD